MAVILPLVVTGASFPQNLSFFHLSTDLLCVPTVCWDQRDEQDMLPALMAFDF